MDFQQRKRERRTDRWLGALALEEYAGRACAELSKGNQQKVQLASAALHEPELLVLDEPFSGLDPVNAEIIARTLETLAAAGTSLVLSSHQMFALEQACRAFCIVGAGMVRASGTLSELRSAFPTRTVRVAPASDAVRTVFARYGAAQPVLDSDGALLYELPATTRFADVLRDAAAAAPIETFERRDPSLEAIYRRALGGTGGGVKGALAELGTVFVTELARRVRSRLFWIATCGGIAAVALLIEAPAIFVAAGRSSGSDIVLAGTPALRARAGTLLDAKKNFRVVAGVDSLPARVTPAYLKTHGNAGAAVALGLRSGRLRLDAYPQDLSSFDAAQLGDDLAPLAIAVQTGQSPASVADAAKIVHAVHPIDRKFADSRSAGVAHGIAFGLIFMLYLAIILASQGVMSSVAEEKTSRIAEILIATIAPWNLLAGKVLAAAAVAIVQVGLWLVTAFLLLPQAAASLTPTTGAVTPADAGSLSLAVGPDEIVAFFAFFVLGYLQYASIYAAAASLISRTEDLGSVTTPIILPVVGAFFIAQYALAAPNATLVVVTSFVPFFSPFVMFTRLAISDVPWWQTALAAGLDAATVVLAFWAAGKIYRVGMLLYGRLPSPKQIVAALRA